jgi:hypothetical protein
MRHTRFPNVANIAKQLGVDRVWLWKALRGENAREDLVAKYYELVGPEISEQAARLGAELPAAARIRMPSHELARLLAAQLVDKATRRGRAVILSVPFVLVPTLAPGGEHTASGALTITQ